MANAIKPLHASVSALTITLASLASSTSGVGRQSTIVDNSTNRYKRIQLSISTKLGTSPTGPRGVYIHLIRSNNDGTPILDDAAGASDAAHTVLNAPLVGVLMTKTSPATGDVLAGNFIIENPGPKWGVSINHDTGVNLDSTGGNHVVSFIGIVDEIQ
jgi:hypothetical protein